MRPHAKRGQIRPKISTMPRQKTEAAAYLDIYKLVNEKKRLQQELIALDERRAIVQERLAVLETQIADLETTAHQIRDQDALSQSAEPSSSTPLPRQKPSPQNSDGSFNTLFLEY